MRSPSTMSVLQIELTNACPHNCSNCTRMCGHHKKPFFMSWDIFKQAVLSLEGFQGMAGIMGGEPTLHPEFEKFTRYLVDNFGSKEPIIRGRKPITDFSKYCSQELLTPVKNGRGLWSSVGKNYYKHFEVIQESFHYQVLNEHHHSGTHQAVLVSRKDAGISNKQWPEIRDACWLQNNWSASITPKGAFFCEVAAAMDMLFDGPGGWPIEKGWWRRTPNEFGEQLKWCEYCGFAFKGPLSEAREEYDDVSPSLYKMLKKIDSPKLKRGEIKLFEGKVEITQKVKYVPGKPFYLPDGNKEERIRQGNGELAPKSIKAIVFSNPGEKKEEIINKFSNYGFEKVTTASSYFYTGDTKEADDAISENALGKTIKKVVESDGKNDWLIFLSQNAIFDTNFYEQLRCTVFNPGCLYKLILSDKIDDGLTKKREVSHESNSSSAQSPFVFFILNIRAFSFKKLNFGEIKSIDDLFNKWDKSKIICFNDQFDSINPLQNGK